MDTKNNEKYEEIDWAVASMWFKWGKNYRLQFLCEILFGYRKLKVVETLIQWIEIYC